MGDRVPCMYCDGSGFDPDPDETTCHACSGEGWRNRADLPPPADDAMMRKHLGDLVDGPPSPHVLGVGRYLGGYDYGAGRVPCRLCPCLSVAVCICDGEGMISRHDLWTLKPVLDDLRAIHEAGRCRGFAVHTIAGIPLVKAV